jgi:hypothetical protein
MMSEYFYDVPGERGRLYREGEDWWCFRIKCTLGDFNLAEGAFCGTAAYMDLTEDDKRRAIDRRKKRK